MISLPGDTFLVGGAVRDRLLGLDVNERDWLVVGCPAAEMENLGFRIVGNDFPVYLHPESNEEYALARTERKVGQGHLGFQTTANEKVTLEEDLARRDLTINAIAEGVDGVLYDPYNGKKDISDKVLRHVTGAFREDPLRVLRVARFAARFYYLGFTIAPETRKLMAEMGQSCELETLPAERIWRETEKALATKNPRIFFETLRDCGALNRIFPEVDALFGIPQRPEYHPEVDTGLHTMLALDQICQKTNNTRMRFATLVHDLGKATTPKDLLPRHHGHELRSAELTEKLCKRLKIPNDYKKLAVKVARYHLHCHRALELKPSSLEELLSNLDAWRTNDYLTGFVNCCLADARGRTGLENRPYPQFEFLLECAKAAKNIDVSLLREQGLEGEKLGEAIRQARIRALSSVKEQYSHIDEHQYARTKTG